MGPLPGMLETAEGPRAFQSVFRAENVPLGIVDRSDMRLPLASLMGLFERGARVVGDRFFGLTVGNSMTHTGFGLWMEYSAFAPSLEVGLRRSVATCHFQQSGGRLALEFEGAFAVWRYITPPLPVNRMQHSDHLIGPMKRFISSYLGANWRPAWVDVNYPRDGLSHLLEEHLQCPVRFGAPGVGIAFDADYLKCGPLPRGSGQTVRQLTLLDVAASETDREFGEPIQSVFSIVVLRLLDGRSDIEGSAQMAGVGVQTLQRMLRREGASYRKLVDVAKLARARALLDETGQSVTDVALGLGYSDHANFTRAFSRWMGCSPSDYRRASFTDRLAANAT